MMLRDYRQALEQFERSFPRPWRVAAFMAGCHAALGAPARARELAAECMARKPDFTIARCLAKQPFKRSTDAAHFADCLRAAGLPD
jgi:hypothetical protein